jgi:hypothetical protein
MIDVKMDVNVCVVAAMFKTHRPCNYVTVLPSTLRNPDLATNILTSGL